MSDNSKAERNILTETLLPSLFVIVFLIAVSTISYQFAKPDEKDFALEYNSVRHIAYPLVLTVLFAFFYIKTQTFYSNYLKKCFLKEKSNRLLHLTFLNINFWLEILFLSIGYFAFELSDTFPFLYYGFLSENPTLSDKLIVFAILLGAFITISFLARGYNAAKWTSDCKTKKVEKSTENTDGVSEKDRKVAVNANRLIPTPSTLGTMRYFAYNYSGENPALTIEDCSEQPNKSKLQAFSLLFAVFIFFILFADFVAGTVLMTLVPFFIMLAKPSLLIAILIVIFSIPIIRRITAIFSRLRFISKLKKLCKENKYKLSKISFPIKSLFFQSAGESFNVTVNKNTYSCKLISGKKASLPMIINQDGSGIRIHAFVFAGIKWFQKDVKFDFGYESKYKKVLIIHPNSKFVCTVKNGGITELDNGDRVGDYYVYTAQSFLNNINRDSIK